MLLLLFKPKSVEEGAYPAVFLARGRRRRRLRLQEVKLAC